MINANELRIGNLFKRGDELVEVDSIFRSHFNCRRIVDKVDLGNNHQSNYQNIPLTEEILLKCGFSYDTYKTYSLKIAEYCFIQIHFTDDLCVKLSESFEIDSHSMEYGIKNLHQLQNLFFALTNEELEITL
jgi:hypothetical protein